MRVKVIEKEVMDPLGDSEINNIKISPIPQIINKITFFDNTKPNADFILDTIKKSLNIEAVDTQKPAGAPANEPQIKEAKKGDVVIMALGDCGSCTTWVILDAIRLEKDGIPVICICTHKFADYGRSLAKAQGIQDLRIIEIQHPIAGLKKNEIELKTEKIIPEVNKMLKL